MVGPFEAWAFSQALKLDPRLVEAICIQADVKRINGDLKGGAKTMGRIFGQLDCCAFDIFNGSSWFIMVHQYYTLNSHSHRLSMVVDCCCVLCNRV